MMVAEVTAGGLMRVAGKVAAAGGMTGLPPRRAKGMAGGLMMAVGLGQSSAGVMAEGLMKVGAAGGMIGSSSSSAGTGIGTIAAASAAAAGAAVETGKSGTAATAGSSTMAAAGRTTVSSGRAAESLNALHGRMLIVETGATNAIRTVITTSAAVAGKQSERRGMA
jgi:hypothetical protein